MNWSGWHCICGFPKPQMEHVRPVTNSKLLGRMLRLKVLKISDFEFRNRDRELHLAVKPYKNGCRCPHCGRRGRIVHLGSEARRWEDATILGIRIIFHYAPREIDCPTHGRVQEEIPWAAAYSRVTYRLEYRICALCQIMTQKAAAEILKMSTSTLSDLLHRVINRARDGHRIRGLTTVGVDEISYCKGRKFATIVYDLDRACVLWVGKGKGRETIDLTNAVGEGLNRIIKIVKNRASGFRTLDSFADLIFLTVGDLDILAQIPSELRTL